MAEKAIAIRGLNYSYPDGTKALKGITLNIAEGESVGIIGPNGAGKSTLLLQLNGILRGAGNIKIFGTEVEEKNYGKIRGMVGVVFQEPDNQLFMPTVFDDVAFGPLNMGLAKEQVGERVEDALTKVDMLPAMRKTSHHLSFGEKKRVSVATVLSMSPKVIALDEPSSNLDPKHRRGLIDLLNSFDMTKVVVTHDLDLVSKVCSRVIIIDRGEITADGLAADILNDRELLAKHDLAAD